MTTYAELTQQILDYTETDTNVLTAAITNDFIEHAELRIFRELDLDVFKKNAQATLTSGTQFVTMPGVVPTSFEFVRYVAIYSSSGSLGGLTDNEKVILQKKEASFLTEYWPNASSTGVPKYYANYDEDSLILAPTPNAAYTMSLEYNAQPTGLSSSNTTTWVSTNAPQLLLYACLIEAFKFLKHPEMMAMYTQSYQSEMQTLGQEQMGRRRRDEYSDGIVRIPMPSPQP